MKLEDWLVGKGCMSCIKLKRNWKNSEEETGYYYMTCAICEAYTHQYCYGLNYRKFSQGAFTMFICDKCHYLYGNGES
jgi:hypothetical protein